MSLELEELAEKSLKFIVNHGCDYTDIRAEQTQKSSVLFEDRDIESVSVSQESGIGIRILKDNCWAFLSVSSPTEFGYIGQLISKIKFRSKNQKINLVDYPSFNEKTISKTEIIPSIEDIKKIGFDCHDIIKQKANIIKTNIHNQFNHTRKLYMNSSSSNILQDYFDTFSEISVTARDSGITQSVNITEGGRGGLEKLLKDDKIFRSADEISQKASLLPNAKPIKEQKTTLVMNPDFVSLLTHEILGHPSEGDRVMGKEMAWAGGAWWAGKLGEKIGTEGLTVFDDPTIEGTFGSYKFDDEGVKASRTSIVEKGVLRNHFQSRETAYDFGTNPTGNMRATSYRFLPLIRMACTCIDRGDWSPDEMIKETKSGYLVCNMKIPSIDMKRYNWSISAQYAYSIENGEIGDLARDVLVLGNSPDFFNSIDACGNDFQIRPILNCGKGDPMQVMMMGNGGPSIRSSATIRST